MDDHATRHSQRAAAGHSKAVRQDYVPPDTRIIGPDGTLRILGRRVEAMDPVMAFHKFNPTRRDSKNGKRLKPGAVGTKTSRRNGGAASLPFGRKATKGIAGAGDGLIEGILRRPMDVLGRIPFMNMLVTAALAHRVWSFVTRRFFGGGASGGSAAARIGDRQLAKRGGEYDDDDEEDEDDDLNERAEELLGRMQHASMLPTMLRSSLPRPHRTSLAKRAAQQYHSRPRGYRTAHQIIHGGPANATTNGVLDAGIRGSNKAGQAAGGAGRRQAQRRQLGKLEKMDLIVRQQVRAAMLAQQRQQEHLLQQQIQLGALEAGPSCGTRLRGLSVAQAAVDHAGSNGSSCAVQRQSPLPLPHPNPQHASSGPLVLAGIGATPAAAGAVLPLHGLELGMPPPPAFRPLPPELRARLQGMRQTGAAAMAPAFRAAAAGPPPAPQAGAQLPCANNDTGLGAAAAFGIGSSGNGWEGAIENETSARAQGQSQLQGQDEGPIGNGIAALVSGKFEDSDAKIVVPRVARSARNASKAVDGAGT
ncbi:hypothetical protein Vretimale_2853 [Volvox reticuliferus]|uniref:Uncharacterized protein n=1 Tax=Volvox reticuliferus TaxID=1737510 RepID=A0A8J4D779_9CHLO|nr:hypothetical protein Vretifemale_1877 [Volvox reticuliferus]GIL97104.1 hypothetical protein Vretimale_2853 [Volvox reticuliferus]